MFSCNDVGLGAMGMCMCALVCGAVQRAANNAGDAAAAGVPACWSIRICDYDMLPVA